MSVPPSGPVIVIVNISPAVNVVELDILLTLTSAIILVFPSLKNEIELIAEGGSTSQSKLTSLRLDWFE